MLHLVDVDIFTLDVEAVVNPVNTDGIMGKGLAEKFKNMYPDMFKKYQTKCAQDKLKIGKLFIYKQSKDYKYIVNFPTKKSWRESSNLSYIDEGLHKLVRFISDKQVTSLAIPALGCGCGQLSWDIVYPCMKHHLYPLIECQIYLCLPQKR